MINYIKYVNSKGEVKLDFTSQTELLFCSIEGISENEIDISQSTSIGQIGSTTTYTSIQPRSMSIKGRIIKNYAINRKFVLSIITPDEVGRLIVNKNGTEYYWNVTVEMTPQFENTAKYEYFEFDVVADYPYPRTVETEQFKFSSITSGYRYPRNFSGTWQIATTSKLDYSNLFLGGSVAIGLKIVITALTDFTNPLIVNTRNYNQLKFNISMKAGQKLIVSTALDEVEKYVLLIDGDTETNAFKYLSKDSDFIFQLMPGDNVIRYQADTNAQGMQIEIDYPTEVLYGI